MKQSSLRTLVTTAVLAVTQLSADVPPPRLHRPDVPFFLQSMRFRTAQMRVFPAQTSGMVTDLYSDLSWNPAFVLTHSGRSVYLDFNPEAISAAPTFPVVTPYGSYAAFSSTAMSSYMVLPTWYPNSVVNPVQTDPIYNFAFLSRIGDRMSVAFINRSIFDYGPFRSATAPRYVYYDAFAFGDAEAVELEPERLEIDNNQQTVPGNQSELIVGLRLSDRLDLGVRLGHFIFRRDGTLYDSKWATYPHSSFGRLEDESLDIDGDHIEVGAGLIFRLNERTRLGIYAALINGEGSETVASLDTSDSWGERDTDPKYYSISEFTLQSDETYTSRGQRPNMTITLERDLSSNLTLRSFFTGSKSTLDITGSAASSDTSYSDRTYNWWDNQRAYFQRREAHGSRQSALTGSGKEEATDWRWFTSLIYAPEDNWSAFGGVHISRRTHSQTFDESSDYKSHSWQEFTGRLNEEYRNFYTHEKLYSVESSYERWSLFLPIGVKARVASGLHLLLGTDITLTLTDRQSGGDLLYPERITRKWEDGSLVVEDEEVDRYEQYSSDPAKELSRAVQQRFGLVYQHSSGATLFLRSLGDISHTANWVLGFEVAF